MTNKKPLLITLTAFLGIMLLIAAAVLFLHGRGGQTVRNDDAPYPYQWVERPDGSVRLTLDGSSVKEGVWTAEGMDDGVVTVELGETSRGKAAATLRAAAEGRTELSFILMNGDERLAEVRMAAETMRKDDRLIVTVFDHSEQAMQRSISGGDEAHPYTAYTDDGGYLMLFIADSAASEEDESALSERWTAESSDELIAEVIELRDAEGGVEVRLGTHVNGVAEVTVSGEESNVNYVFAVTADSGTLRLWDCTWSEFVPQTPVTEEEMNEILSGIADSLVDLEAGANS